MSQKISQANSLTSLPSALQLKLFNDPDTTEPKLLLLDTTLTLHVVSLSGDFKIVTLLQISDLLDSPRSYDLIPLNLFHLNPVTHSLYLSLSRAIYHFDLSQKALSWTLPNLENSMPLCAVSDQDKLVVSYDRENRVVVYDVINKRVHEWSKKNERMPENFTNRYNRITGIV